MSKTNNQCNQELLNKLKNECFENEEEFDTYLKELKEQNTKFTQIYNSCELTSSKYNKTFYKYFPETMKFSCFFVNKFCVDEEDFVSLENVEHDISSEYICILLSVAGVSFENKQIVHRIVKYVQEYINFVNLEQLYNRFMKYPISVKWEYQPIHDFFIRNNYKIEIYAKIIVNNIRYVRSSERAKIYKSDMCKELCECLNHQQVEDSKKPVTMLSIYKSLPVSKSYSDDDIITLNMMLEQYVETDISEDTCSYKEFCDSFKRYYKNNINKNGLIHNTKIISRFTLDNNYHVCYEINNLVNFILDKYN